MRLFGLIGEKLDHSFSPAYFKSKFKKEGILDAYYQLYPLKNINEFTQLVSDFSELSGLNVTIPYKQSIMLFMDEIDPNAREIGAINTIQFKRKNNKLTLKGYNTDYLGFSDSIKPLLKSFHKKALILGTGGSSLAIAHAFKKIGVEYKFVSRNPIKQDSIDYFALNSKLISEYKVLVNTTPLGMYPKVLEMPSIPYEALTKDHILFDLVYNPENTEFLKKGSENGAVCKNGYEMLVKQAEYSWKIWNNLSFEL